MASEAPQTTSPVYVPLGSVNTSRPLSLGAPTSEPLDPSFHRDFSFIQSGPKRLGEQESSQEVTCFEKRYGGGLGQEGGQVQ
jgi:hypothetical protein